MHIVDVEARIRKEGVITFRVAGVDISLDLRNRHERNYAAKLLMDVRYPQSDIDNEIFRAVVHAGDRVLDAGANIGFTALELIQAGAAQVVAVEPVPALYSRLAALRHTLIKPVQCALSAQSGRTKVTVSETHNQGSSIKSEMLALFPLVFGEAPATCEVDVCTIDQLHATYGDMDIWKLDIEGAEVDALEGAQRTLRQSPPRVIIVELYDQFMAAFAERIAPTHPFGYRALLNQGDYRLAFLPTDHPVDNERFEPTSPMYVFTRSALPTHDPLV